MISNLLEKIATVYDQIANCHEENTFKIYEHWDHIIIETYNHDWNGAIYPIRN